MQTLKLQLTPVLFDEHGNRIAEKEQLISGRDRHVNSRARRLGKRLDNAQRSGAPPATRLHVIDVTQTC
jgi:hypothetical protein